MPTTTWVREVYMLTRLAQHIINLPDFTEEKQIAIDTFLETPYVNNRIHLTFGIICKTYLKEKNHKFVDIIKNFANNKYLNFTSLLPDNNDILCEDECEVCQFGDFTTTVTPFPRCTKPTIQ